MRVLLPILLALALVVAACGGDDSEEGSAAPETTTTVTTPEPSADPIEWVWDPGLVIEKPADFHRLAGPNCYGSGSGPPGLDVEVTLADASVLVTTGKGVAPDVVLTDESGVTSIGNPFGQGAWVCSVAVADDTALAVGSAVWWSNDGTAWRTIDRFDGLGGGIEYGGSKLIWVAAGPMGYIVLGRSLGTNRLGWYSPDLTSWYQIPAAAGPDYSAWGWVGPTNLSVGPEQIVISMDQGPVRPGGWVGTPTE